MRQDVTGDMGWLYWQCYELVLISRACHASTIVSQLTDTAAQAAINFIPNGAFLLLWE